MTIPNIATFDHGTCVYEALEGVSIIGPLLGGSSHDLDTLLITMVIVSPLRIGLFHLLTGMILQVSGLL